MLDSIGRIGSYRRWLDCPSATRKARGSSRGSEVTAHGRNSGEKPVCPQKCERVQIIPDSITVIMPVIYVLHTHARTPSPPRLPKFTPRRDDEHAFKQTRSLCGAAWSPLDYLERSHVGSRWKRVGRVGLMGSDTGVDDRFSIDGCGLGRGGRGEEMIRLLRYSLMTLMTAIRWIDRE